MKSQKSAVEVQMSDMIILCNDIIDDNYLTTKDARKLVDLLEKGLRKIEELRESRDKSAARCKELRLERDNLKKSIKQLKKDVKMKKTREPKRCFSCGKGHIKLHKEKVKVNGNPENICEGCYEIFQNKE